MEYPNHYSPIFKKFHPSWVKTILADFSNYGNVVLDNRLWVNINFLGKLTTTQQVETGAFIIKTGLGFNTGRYTVRLTNFVMGENMEIILNPQESLEPGEEYLGTFHAHPITDVPSIHDVLTFIADPMEQVSIVRGTSGYINLMIKKPTTRPLSPEGVEGIEARYPKGPDGMIALVRDFDFLYYQGLTAELKRTYDIQQPPPAGVISLDELAMAITGSSQLPQPNQDLKKKPPGGDTRPKVDELPKNESKGYTWSGKPGFVFRNGKWMKP